MQIFEKEVENYENIHQLSNLEFNERGIGRFERTSKLFKENVLKLEITGN